MNRQPASSGSGPLAGIRVLDLTTTLLGPLATRILGDFGAEVVKIETPRGDLMRANGPARHPGMGSVFLSVNRNKRSIAVDLKSAEGAAIASQLAQGADIFVHNMRPDAILRLGLGYDRLRSLKPEIIYCAATGFGQLGPYDGKKAYDDIIQAMCGLADLAYRDQGEPAYVPTLLADKTAGMAVVNAILAALFHRQKSGEGQYIEVPMFETLVEFVMIEHLAGQTFFPPLSPAGYDRIIEGARGPTRTSDGYVAILPDTSEKWEAFFRRANRADILDLYDFRDPIKLNACARDLFRELSGITPGRSTRDWVALCEELDIAASPIWRIDELIDHPHLKDVGLIREMRHPTEGALKFVRSAAQFRSTPLPLPTPAPRLGEDSRSLLTEMGYGSDQIDGLVSRGIVVVP